MDQQDITQAKAPASRLPSLRPPAGLATRLRRAGILYPFLILFIVLSVSSGPFFTKVNLLDILDQQASTLIIAAAGTCWPACGRPGARTRHCAPGWP